MLIGRPGKAMVIHLAWCTYPRNGTSINYPIFFTSYTTLTHHSNFRKMIFFAYETSYFHMPKYKYIAVSIEYTPVLWGSNAHEYEQLRCVLLFLISGSSLPPEAYKLCDIEF